MSPPDSQGPVSRAVLADTLEAFRSRAPLVQCLTNIVVAHFTANVLLAAGASPVMVDNPAEAGACAELADGVLINLGTPYAETTAAMTAAISSAEAHASPWVLDPVAAGVLEWRSALAAGFLAAHRPAIVRGNASEIMALTGGAAGKGVESLSTAEAASDAGAALALRHDTVVAVSGAVDHLTDGQRLVRVANGHPWLTRITGAGCALGALMAGFAAVTDDPLRGATTATAVLTVAADAAAERAAGPGSFAVALIDALAQLGPETLADRVRLS